MRKTFFLWIIPLFTIFSLTLSACTTSSNSAITISSTRCLDFVKSVPEYQITNHSVDQLEPALLSVYGIRLFAEGKKDEGIFWYWLGALRERLIDHPEDRFITLPEPMVEKIFREGGFGGNLIIQSTRTIFPAPEAPENARSKVSYSLELPNRYVVLKFTNNLDHLFLKEYETKNIKKFHSILSQVIDYEKQHPFDRSKLAGYPFSRSEEQWKDDREKIIDQFNVLLQTIQENEKTIYEKALSGFYDSSLTLSIDQETNRIIAQPWENQILYLFNI